MENECVQLNVSFRMYESLKCGKKYAYDTYTIVAFSRYNNIFYFSQYFRSIDTGIKVGAFYYIIGPQHSVIREKTPNTNLNSHSKTFK